MSLLVHSLISTKQTPKENKELALKCHNIKTDIRQRVLALYFARRNLQHIIRFIMWMLINRPGKYDEA
jgi:hypothetical protein